MYFRYQVPEISFVFETFDMSCNFQAGMGNFILYVSQQSNRATSTLLDGAYGKVIMSLKKVKFGLSNSSMMIDGVSTKSILKMDSDLNKAKKKKKTQTLRRLIWNAS